MEKRHSKLFTNCHVPWDTLYVVSLQSINQIVLPWLKLFVTQDGYIASFTGKPAHTDKKIHGTSRK